MSVERWLTPVDVRLLSELAHEPNLVHAARTLGIGRDRAVYRLRRLERLYHGAVATGHRGGTTPGVTRLTPIGRRLLRSMEGRHAGANRWTGVYRTGPPPHVEFAPGAGLEVSFRGREGAQLTVEVDPEAFVVARRPVDLSARNALVTRVERVQVHANGTAALVARWGDHSVRVALTSNSVARMGLKPRVRAYLYVKAVAVRRVASPGSLPS